MGSRVRFVSEPGKEILKRLSHSMEEIKEQLKLDALRDPSKAFGFDFREDVIVLKYFQLRLSIHEPGLRSSILWSSSLSEDLAITRSN